MQTFESHHGLARGLALLQAFIGLSAVIGGALLMLEPSGRLLNLPLELLAPSPFADYLIPGVILFTIIGLDSLVGGVASWLCWRYAGELALVLGTTLMVWILVQVHFVGYANWLQPFYFALGALEALLGLRLWRGRAAG